MGPIGEAVLKACIWEATAAKAGNVHRFADFDDLTYPDFVLSAGMIAPILDVAPTQPLGETILAAVRATRRVTMTNTNLGIILLLAPLAAAAVDRQELARRLDATTVDDSRHVYAAIRHAQPGGLGKVENEDIGDEPTLSLREVMALAATRDRIAAQYAHEFVDVWDFGVPVLRDAWQRHGRLEPAIQTCQIEWLCAFSDSLIERKHGAMIAEKVRHSACEVRAGHWKWEAFDRQLRQSHWNPGTTADLVTACLFIGFYEGWLGRSTESYSG